jgi:hypothetical protein
MRTAVVLISCVTFWERASPRHLSMEAGYLNTFHPYENKSRNHEDQLTRAFLILMRASAQVRYLFVEMLREEMKGEVDLPPTIQKPSDDVFTIQTQVWSTTIEKLASEFGRLVSVLITDERLGLSAKVERTDRVAVYDGFIKYGTEWIFVIENKPNRRNVWPEQLSSAFHEGYSIAPTPIELTWGEILRRLNALKQKVLIHDAAKILVEDFLDFTSAQFPEICPFDRFHLCEANQGRLQRRCVVLMTEAGFGMWNTIKGGRIQYG